MTRLYISVIYRTKLSNGDDTMGYKSCMDSYVREHNKPRNYLDNIAGSCAPVRFEGIVGKT